MISLLRTIALVIALSIPSYAFAAVTTVVVQAVTTGWTDLGAGPFLAVQSEGSAQQNIFAIADTTPAMPAFGFHISPDHLPWASATVSHLWVIGTGSVVVSK
jgi:hypothetical protein